MEFGILESLFWRFGKRSFIRKTSDTFEDHDGKDWLLVKSHLKSGTVQDQVDDSSQKLFIFNEGEDVFTPWSIYLLSFASAKIVKIDRLSVNATEYSFTILLPLCFCLPQSLKIFSHVFFHSRSLKGNVSVLQQINWHIVVIFKDTRKDKVFELSCIALEFFHCNFSWKLNFNSNSTSYHSAS